MAASLTAMLVQDCREEVSPDVDDIKRQFPETSSGVKALHNLHGFKARTVLRKLGHAIQFVV